MFQKPHYNEDKKVYIGLALHLSQCLAHKKQKIKLLSYVHNVVYKEIYSSLSFLMPISTYLIFADHRAVLTATANITKVKYL